jgi:hypothetical protein
VVDQRGNAPRFQCLQGIDAAFCLALLVLDSGFDPDSPVLQTGAITRFANRANWCGQGESNSRPFVGNEGHYHYAMSAWWVIQVTILASAKASVLQTAPPP